VRWRKTKDEAAIGDIRYKRKFAWFPVTTTDNDNVEYVVWLETYQQTQRFYGEFWLPIKNQTLFFC
jgi:hypothetical protein